MQQRAVLVPLHAEAAALAVRPLAFKHVTVVIEDEAAHATLRDKVGVSHIGIAISTYYQGEERQTAQRTEN